MNISLTTLVTVILTVAVLIFAIAITFVFSQTSQDTEATCAASVAAQAGLVAGRTAQNAELRGCTTQTLTLEGNEQRVNNQLMQAYTRCKNMFGPAQNQRVIRDPGVFCHVCGIYETPQVNQLTTLYQQIRAQESESLFSRNKESLTILEEETIDASGPIGIVFFQAYDMDANWFESLVERVRARSLIATTVLSTVYTPPEANFESGIIIIPYTHEEIQQTLGCTTIDPSIT